MDLNPLKCGIVSFSRPADGAGQDHPMRVYMDGVEWAQVAAGQSIAKVLACGPKAMHVALDKFESARFNFSLESLDFAYLTCQQPNKPLDFMFKLFKESNFYTISEKLPKSGKRKVLTVEEFKAITHDY